MSLGIKQHIMPLATGLIQQLLGWFVGGTSCPAGSCAEWDPCAAFLVPALFWRPGPLKWQQVDEGENKKQHSASLLFYLGSRSLFGQSKSPH